MKEKTCLACGSAIEKGEFCGSNFLERFYSTVKEDEDLKDMQAEQKFRDVQDLERFSIETF